MMIDFDYLYSQYQEYNKIRDKYVANKKKTEVISNIASHFPRDNPEKLKWLISALKDEKKKWFVAEIMEKINPIPKSLFENLILASMLEPNPSTNKYFILPCLKTYSRDQIKEVMDKYSKHPEVIENDGYDKVAYWAGLKSV
jgi:hypothetical protein